MSCWPSPRKGSGYGYESSNYSGQNGGGLATLEISHPAMRKTGLVMRPCSLWSAWLNAPHHHPSPRQYSPTHPHKPMPTDPESVPSTPARKPWTAGCVVHRPPSPQSPQTTVWLDGQPAKALLDSASTFTLVRPSALPTSATLCDTVKVTCMHGVQVEDR